MKQLAKSTCHTKGKHQVVVGGQGTVVGGSENQSEESDTPTFHSLLFPVAVPTKVAEIHDNKEKN